MTSKLDPQELERLSEAATHWRKKPVVIDAIKWTGDNINQISEFMAFPAYSHHTDTGLHIHTLEGTIYASEGDWIIKGVAGEFYPCKPDIFAQTYEPAECTGQLVPAMPSGDVVEAAWETLKARCCADPANAKRCVMVSKDDFTAAITTYEAVSGVAKMREALEPAFVTSETEGGLSTDKVQYKLVFKFRSLAELDAAHSAWIYRKGDGRCVD